MKKPCIPARAVAAVAAFLVCLCAQSEQGKPLRLCGGLGSVYGLAFSASGALLASGTEGDSSVIWTVGEDGKASRYVELVDPREALSVIGISVHSRYAADMAVDDAGNLFIATRLPAGAFIVTADKSVRKIYLNMEYAVSLEEKDPPHGVAYDAQGGKLFLVTSGPKSATSTTQVTHLAGLPFDRGLGDYEGFFTGDHDDIFFVKNAGITLAFKPVALAKAPNGALFCVSRNAVYRIDGEKAVQVAALDGLSAWGAAADSAGNLYVTANAAGYSPGAGSGKGQILKFDAKGKRSLVSKSVQEPLGIAIRKGRLYVADFATQSVWIVTP